MHEDSTCEVSVVNKISESLYFPPSRPGTVRPPPWNRHAAYTLIKIFNETCKNTVAFRRGMHKADMDASGKRKQACH